VLAVLVVVEPVVVAALAVLLVVAVGDAPPQFFLNQSASAVER